MKQASLTSVATRADSIEHFTQSLFKAAGVDTAAEKREIMHAAVDKYVQEKKEHQVLSDAGVLLKTFADMDHHPPNRNFAQIAHEYIMPKIAQLSKRYEQAQQLPCTAEILNLLMACSDPDDDDYDAQSKRVQTAIENSLAAERFALTYAKLLNLKCLRALANFPLAFVSQRIERLQKQFEHLEKRRLEESELFLSFSDNNPLSAEDEKHVSDVGNIYTELGFDVRMLGRNRDGTATQQLSPWIKRRLKDELTPWQITLCTDFFANKSAASAFKQARPKLNDAWQDILNSPLLGAMLEDANKQIKSTQNTLGTSLPGTPTADGSDRQAA